ncbi:MAG: hypothetical protein KF878_18835 [Planctomycetes bacterium]|nr:hypothetical protein [Planctomycetota bacterium]
MEDLKRALGSTVFLKDLARVEPGKKGVAVGEVLRIYDDKGVYTLSFLRGTDERTRKQYRDRLDLAKLEYRLGADFAL